MNFLTDRRLIFFLRIGLGVLFLIAGIPKFLDPQAFATSISHYQLLPEWGERALALVLPPLEIAIGIALIVGVLDAGAAVLCFLLLIVFTGAIGISVARGLDISCGCFETEGGTKVGAKKLLENTAFIVAAYLVVIGDRSWLAVRSFFGRS